MWEKYFTNKFSSSGIYRYFNSSVRRANLLHSEVSYIIDIACHWTYLQYYQFELLFRSPKPWFFFHFPTPNICRTVPSELAFTNVDLDYWAKTCYQPLFRHCFQAVLQYLAIFYESLHYIRKSGLKAANISTKSAMFRILELRSLIHELVMCACGFYNFVMTSGIFNEL